MAVHLTVDGAPAGKGRPRFSRRGGFVRTYTDAKTLAFEARVRQACQQVMGSAAAVLCPVALRVVAFWPVPASWSKRKRQQALEGLVVPGKPDADNIAKAVMDALIGVLYADDSQVCSLRVDKSYSLAPRIEIFANQVMP